MLKYKKLKKRKRIEAENGKISVEDLKFEKDYQTYGNVDAWIVVCEAWSIKHQWKKTTKVMNTGSDCIMSVSSQFGHNVAEALQLIPNKNYDINTKAFIKIKNEVYRDGRR